MDQQDWQKLVNVAAPAGAVGLAVAIARGVIDQCGGWKKWIAGLVAAPLVAAWVGLGLHESGTPIYMQFSIVGLCAYVARDILTGLTQLSSMLAQSPFEFATKIRDFLRGRNGQ